MLRTLDSIIEDLVVAVHRRHLEPDELLETAERVFAFATQLDWPDDLGADIEDLKRPLAAGWERRFWEASAKAIRRADEKLYLAKAEGRNCVRG